MPGSPKKKPVLPALLLASSFAVSGCPRLADLAAWQSLGQPRQGVPLQHFQAHDGRYFPDFIRSFFPGARTFELHYPASRQASEGIQLIEVRPLSTGTLSSNEANLSWSWDGAYLGYEVISSAQRQILVKDLVGNYSRKIAVMPRRRHDFLNGLVSAAVHSYNASLRWSYDSTRYAFMSNGGVGQYNIYVGAVGEEEVVVAQSPTKNGYASWNPTRNEIVFVSSRSGQGDLYLISLAAGGLQRLSDSGQGDLFPEWFPDGQKIVYTSGDASNHDLMLLTRQGSSPEGAWQRPYPLTAWSQDDLRPVVSPDGRHIAFYATSPTHEAQGQKSWNLHVVPYVPGKTFSARELASMVVARQVVIDLNTGPAWSPDSQKVFYVADSPSSFNPIYGYDLFTGKRYVLRTATKMNRDLIMSRLGILSFRAQTGAWDRVYLALTNQGAQLQLPGKISRQATDKRRMIYSQL